MDCPIVAAVSRVGRRPIRPAATAALLALVIAGPALAGRGMQRETANLSLEKKERELGYATARDVLSHMPRIADDSVAAEVRSIGQALVAFTPRAKLPFEFHVLNIRPANAFSLPGGYVFVTRGMLDVLQDRDELAAILGHEIAHVCSRHTERTIEHQQHMAVLGTVAGSLVGGFLGVLAAGPVNPLTGVMSPSQIITQNAFSGFFRAVAAGLQGPQASIVLRGYTKEMESSADGLCLEYLKAAGRDLAALPRALDRLREHDEGLKREGLAAVGKAVAAKPGLEARAERARRIIDQAGLGK